MKALVGGVLTGLFTATVLGWALRPGPIPPSPEPVPPAPAAREPIAPCPLYQPVPAPELTSMLPQLERDLALLQARLEVEIGAPLPEEPGDDGASVRAFFDGLELGPYRLHLDCTEHPCLAELEVPLDDPEAPDADATATPWIEALVASYPGSRTEVRVGASTPGHPPHLRLRATVHTALAAGEGQERRLEYRWRQFHRAR